MSCNYKTKKICEFLDNIIKDDNADINDVRKNIQNMRKDGVYGTGVEINGFLN